MGGSTFAKIYEVVKQIPYGHVATYGQVAMLAGNRRWARVVGYALLGEYAILGEGCRIGRNCRLGGTPEETAPDLISILFLVKN